MIRKGTVVVWNWGKGTARGKVVESYTSKVTKTIKNTSVTRKGEKGNKALYIKQEQGGYVLKSESEVERVDGCNLHGQIVFKNIGFLFFLASGPHGDTKGKDSQSTYKH